MLNRQTLNRTTQNEFPKNTLQAVRDLVYQGKGSIIPHFRKRFDWDSLMAARFTDTHEAAPDVLDIIAFKDPDEKRYLLEVYLKSKDIPFEWEKMIMDEMLYLVIAIRGTYDSSKLAFFAWVNFLEKPFIVEIMYDLFSAAKTIFMNSKLNFQRCIRR